MPLGHTAQSCNRGLAHHGDSRSRFLPGSWFTASCPVALMVLFTFITLTLLILAAGQNEWIWEWLEDYLVPDKLSSPQMYFLCPIPLQIPQGKLSVPPYFSNMMTCAEKEEKVIKKRARRFSAILIIIEKHKKQSDKSIVIVTEVTSPRQVVLYINTSAFIHSRISHWALPYCMKSTG